MHDVLIAGAGPSGLCIASELALAGVRVKVLERREAVVQSRAGTILPRVLELLDSRGLAGRFIQRARGIRPNPLFTTHIWAGMQPVHWEHLGSRFGFRMILPQNVTEELLYGHALSLGVEIERNVTVAAVEQDADGVSVRVEDKSGERTLRAPWLIGADGGRSAVRKAIGMPFEGHDASFTGIVADVVTDQDWVENRRMTDNEKGWITSFPFSDEDNIVRFNIVSAERRHTPQSEPVTLDEVRACIRDVFPTEVPIVALRWASRFTDAMRVVDNLRDRRVMLVGESARIHYPASGVGMNFCIQDAFNLGWKLAAVVRGHARCEVLDTYNAERMPVARALLESVKSQCAVQFDFSPEGVAFKRMFQAHMMPLPQLNSRLAHELNGLTMAYPAPAEAHPLVGWRAPDVDLITVRGETRIGVLLRSGKFLLIDLTGSGAYDDLSLGELPVERVSAMPTNVPAALAGVRSLLVRPDGYVAWAATRPPAPDEARAELARWLELPL